MASRKLPQLALSPCEPGTHSTHLKLPSPRAALRHACPVVLEAMLAPLALFYLVLIVEGFRGALIAALAWSYLALVRRLKRGERVSTLLLVGTGLLTVRTVVSFVTGSAFLYFAQPMATTVVISLVLVGSAVVGRPFTQRFAHDFCPLDPQLLARPASVGSSSGSPSCGRLCSCSMPGSFSGFSSLPRCEPSSSNARP